MPQLERSERSVMSYNWHESIVIERCQVSSFFTSSSVIQLQREKASLCSQLAIDVAVRGSLLVERPDGRTTNTSEDWPGKDTN